MQLRQLRRNDPKELPVEPLNLGPVKKSFRHFRGELIIQNVLKGIWILRSSTVQNAVSILYKAS